MIIDAHQHAFWGDRDDAGLVADLDANGIDRAWLLSWEIPPGEDDRLYHKVLSPRHLRPDGTHAVVVLADLIIARNPLYCNGLCPNQGADLGCSAIRIIWRKYKRVPLGAYYTGA